MKIRIIPRLDIKGPNLVKGIQLEGLRVIGDPHEFALKYFEQGADEILYVDIVASLYGRNNLVEIVRRTAKSLSVPLIVAGGVRSLEDIKVLLRAGADKVSINTAAVENPDLIKQAAQVFGSQCIVVAIDIKRWPDDSFLSKRNETVSRTAQAVHEKGDFYQVYTENGRQQTGLEAYNWALKAASLGAGELMLTSIDQEGLMKGYERDFIQKVSHNVSIPVIAGGGAGNLEHVYDMSVQGNCQAVTVASLLHYNRHTVSDIKKHLGRRGIGVSDHI